MNYPNLRMVALVLAVSMLSVACAATEAVTSGRPARADEAALASETASSLADATPDPTVDGDEPGTDGVEPGPDGADQSADPGAAAEDFTGGDLVFPRAFRYGLLDMEILDAAVVDGRSTISVRIHNPHDEEVGSVYGNDFRILEGDRTWTDLEYADDEYSLDVEARGVVDVVLVGEQVELSSAALQYDDGDTVPAIVPFGGAYEAPVGRSVEAGQSSTTAFDGCYSEDVQLRATVDRASVEIDVDKPRGGYTSNMGRAEADQRFLLLEVTFEQLNTCDNAIDIDEHEVELDGNSDFKLHMAEVKLLENKPVVGELLIEYPLGAETVSFTIGTGDPIVVAVG